MVTITRTTTTWTPTTHADYDQLTGQPVRSADAETLGTIAAVLHPKQAKSAARGGHCVVVKPGMLRQQSWFGRGSEFYVPESAIADVTEDGVRLTYPKDQLEAQGWGQPPADLAQFNRA